MFRLRALLKAVTTRSRALNLHVLVLVLVLGVGFLVSHYLHIVLGPVDPTDGSEVEVYVPPRSTTAAIAGLLHRAGVINDPLAFRLLARWRGVDGLLKAGEYRFSRDMAMNEIIDKLVAGEVVTYSFTIPEGYTLSLIADKLSSLGFVDRERFVALAHDPSFVPEFVPHDALDVIPHPVEGYLFPDTYVLTREATEEDILRMMLDRFREVFNDEMRQRAEELGMTVHEVVTLASIIEAEARVAAERPIISGVYHNRLRIGMKLDADPTVRYVLDVGAERPLFRKDLEVDSPYNTYRNAGLPPGPINNPGLASIEAALYPADVDYLYFVSKGDGTGEHAFSETYAEHLQNLRKYQK